MLNVQQYLKQFSLPETALNQLHLDFGIKIKKYSDRVVLNYDQINSPRFHDIADECRGLILSYPSFDVLAQTYKRFYNLGENSFQPSNWSEWTLFEKADGSLIYFYEIPDHSWEIATRGTAFAEASMLNQLMTFRQGVLCTLGFDESAFQAWCRHNLRSGFTYIFDYCGPENRIVTPYQESVLVMHGCVDNTSGQDDFLEMERVIALHHPKIRCARRYAVHSTDELNQAIQDLGGLEEGFVCYNTKSLINNEPLRIKVKSPSYLVVHKMRGDTGVLSAKGAITLFLDDAGHEYLTYYPEDKPMIDKVSTAYHQLLEEITAVWNATQHISEQKEFALAVKDYKFSAILFKLRQTKQQPIDEMLAFRKVDELIFSQMQEK